MLQEGGTSRTKKGYFTMKRKFLGKKHHRGKGREWPPTRREKDRMRPESPWKSAHGSGGGNPHNLGRIRIGGNVAIREKSHLLSDKEQTRLKGAQG